MTPGFRTFVRLCGLRVPGEHRSLWASIANLKFSEEERQLLNAIESRRRELSSSDTVIERVDFGAGSKYHSNAATSEVPLATLSKRASVSPNWGALLFRMIRQFQPDRVLELGSCVGLSAAYIQTALDLNKSGTLTTIEGDPALCEITRATLSSISQSSPIVVEGRFIDTLPATISSGAPFDFVFIDGHHDPDAVRSYFSMLEAALSRPAVVIIDDIFPLIGPVRPAWKAIAASKKVDWKVDFLRMGLIQIGSTQ